MGTPLLRKGALALLLLAAIAFAGATFSTGEVTETERRAGARETEVAAPGAATLALRPAVPDGGWLPVKRPVAVYSLESPELEGARFSLAVFAQGRNNRQDVLAWRSVQDRRGQVQRPDVRVIVERFEKEQPTWRPLYADLALRAAEADASIQRMGPPDELVAKFGGFEVADAVLAFEEGPLSCLVFRRIDSLGFAVAGWYCGSTAHPVNRVGLGCFLDRLDLVSAGQDKALKRLFSAAELRRQGCRSTRPPGRKLSWLDHDAPVPALKTSFNLQR